MKSINYTNKPFIIRNILGITGAIVTLVIPFFIGSNSTNIENEQSLCPFKMATGFPCPGCGITKSLIFLYQGDVEKSLHYHAFAIPTVLFCLAIIVLLVINLLTKKLYFSNLIFSKKLAYSLAITLITYHGIRLIFFIANNNVNNILKESIWR